MSTIAIYGWGSLLEQCWPQIVNLIGVPRYIFDTSVVRMGREINEVPCIHPENFPDKQRSEVEIYISVRNHEPIVGYLKSIGFKKIKILFFEKSQYSVTKILTPESGKDEFKKDYSLLGRWSIITGGGRGLGKFISFRLAEMGSNLILIGRNQASLSNVSKEVKKKFGITVHACKVDLGSVSDLNDFIYWMVKNNIKPDILINNAATSPALSTGGFYTIPYDDYVEAVKVNSVAPAYLMSRVVPMMIDKGYGRVINISTNVLSDISVAPYAISKAALDKLTFDLASNLRGTGVSINAIDPGAIRTDMTGNQGLYEAESAVTGILALILTPASVNGKFLNAQDYSNQSVDVAVSRMVNNYQLI